MDVLQGTHMEKDYSLTLKMEKGDILMTYSNVHSGQKKVSSTHTCKWGVQQQNSKN